MQSIGAALASGDSWRGRARTTGVQVKDCQPGEASSWASERVSSSTVYYYFIACYKYSYSYVVYLYTHRALQWFGRCLCLVEL